MGKLAGAGVEHKRIRGWALSIAEEYGILAYASPLFDRGRILANDQS
jgi:hypothetical protein